MYFLDSTCSLTSCSICSGSETESESNSSEEETEELQKGQPTSSESALLLKENAKFLLENRKTLRKSFSVDILNSQHPPLPRFPRFDVKSNSRGKSSESPNNIYMPPLPYVIEKDEKLQKMHIPKPELRVSSERKLAVSTTSLASRNKKGKSSEISAQNLEKYNYTSLDSVDGFNNNNLNQQQLSVVDIVPNPKLDIDQTIGIPITFETEPNANKFFSSNSLFNPSIQPSTSSSNYYKMPEIKNDYEYHVPTTIHQYPLISGTIPSANIAISSMPPGSQPKASFPPTYSTTAPSTNLKKKEGTSSILSNTSNSNNIANPGSKKESGEKNKVKFSDTITVAVVPVSFSYQLLRFFFS